MPAVVLKVNDEDKSSHLDELIGDFYLWRSKVLGVLMQWSFSVGLDVFVTSAVSR